MLTICHRTITKRVRNHNVFNASSKSNNNFDDGGCGCCNSYYYFFRIHRIVLRIKQVFVLLGIIHINVCVCVCGVCVCKCLCFNVRLNCFFKFYFLFEYRTLRIRKQINFYERFTHNMQT